MRFSLLLIILLSGLLSARAFDYDFSAAEAHLEENLAVYGNRVVIIVEQEGSGEIFLFRRGLITRDTKLGIASCTKWLSGAVVLACVERGWFRLDDPIGNYLPEFQQNGKGHITIRQCFAMNSGLSLRDPDYEIDPDLTLAQSVSLIAQHTPIVFAPGTQLDYEGDGMQVVGRICEVVSGKDWHTLAREVLFDPLEMNTADYLNFGVNPAIAGGARCSAADYLKFLRMILQNGLAENGTPVISSRSVQEFFTNQTLGLPEYYSPAQDSPFYAYGERPDYGMGSWIMAQHPGTGAVEEVASPGAFGTFPWVDRRRRLRGIIFMLGIGASAWQASVEFQSLVRAEIDTKGLPPLPSASPLTAGRAGHFLKLEWQGGGQLQTSADLQHWTPLPWASSPFLESLQHPPSARLFYRVP